MLHLPCQPGQIGFQHLQIAVAAHVAKGDRAFVQHRLEFLRRREIRRHEGKPEGFAVHGHEVAGHLRFVLGHQHFQRPHHEIGQRIDILAALPHITPVGLEDAQIATRRVDIFRAGNGLRQRFFAIGRAVRMVNIVPFLPEQLRLAEQPVHLFPVPARPECQRAAQSQIGLGLAAEFLLPAPLPQCGKVLAVLGGGAFSSTCSSVRETVRTARFALLFAAFFLAT